MVDLTLRVLALEKLVDYVASGIGRVAGSMLAPWYARREADAKRIAAAGDAESLQIQAGALAEARERLVPHDASVSVEVTMAEAIEQRILYQEEKRQLNIEAVAEGAAKLLGGDRVPAHEPDHDWTARFFGDAQDVSSADMQALWAKVLAGEVAQAGSTSLRTLGILRDLDRPTARLFERFCSACVFVSADGVIVDARVPSLGGHPAQNSLRPYGLGFSDLNRLNEHGLVIPDYNSWFDYRMSTKGIPFKFQNRSWILVPEGQGREDATLRLHGVELTQAGRELSRAVGLRPMAEFLQALREYFAGQKLRMAEVEEVGSREPATD